MSGLRSLAEVLGEILHPSLLARIEAAIDGRVEHLVAQRMARVDVPAALPPPAAAPVEPAPPAVPARREVPLEERTFYDARNDIIRREWPAGTQAARIVEMINATPGRKVDISRVGVQASALGVKRTAAFRRDLSVGNIRAQKPLPVFVAPAAPVSTVSKPPPRIAAYVPPVPSTKPAPPIRTAAQIQRDRERAMVEQHVRDKGVTRCPTAMVEASSATVSAADRKAIAAHDAAREQARADEHTARTARGRKRLTTQPVAGA